MVGAQETNDWSPENQWLRSRTSINKWLGPRKPMVAWGLENQWFGTRQPMIGAEDINVGHQETNGWGPGNGGLESV